MESGLVAFDSIFGNGSETRNFVSTLKGLRMDFSGGKILWAVAAARSSHSGFAFAALLKLSGKSSGSYAGCRVRARLVPSRHDFALVFQNGREAQAILRRPSHLSPDANLAFDGHRDALSGGQRGPTECRS